MSKGRSPSYYNHRGIWTHPDLVSRYKFWNNSDKLCAVCGEFVPYRLATRGHIIDLSEGGSSNPGNIQLEHRRCNSEKQKKA